MYVLAVLELDKQRDTAGATQQNGGLNLDQTQMTSFEINLKDKRFVAAVTLTPKGFCKQLCLQNLCFHIFVEHLNYI